MNEKNLDHLKNSLKYLGFGDKLNDVLEKAIRQELPKFTITLNNTISPPGIAKEDTVERDFVCRYTHRHKIFHLDKLYRYGS